MKCSICGDSQSPAFLVSRTKVKPPHQSSAEVTFPNNSSINSSQQTIEQFGQLNKTLNQIRSNYSPMTKKGSDPFENGINTRTTVQNSNLVS